LDLEKFLVEKQLLLEQNSSFALTVPDAPSPLKVGQANGAIEVRELCRG